MGEFQPGNFQPLMYLGQSFFGYSIVMTQKNCYYILHFWRNTGITMLSSTSAEWHECLVICDCTSVINLNNFFKYLKFENIYLFIKEQLFELFWQRHC